MKPINEGRLIALKSDANEDEAHYTQRGLEVDEQYLPILSGYSVSEKVRLI